MVRLFLDMTYLGENVCSALGIDYNSPITITLTFTEQYLDAPWV